MVTGAYSDHHTDTCYEASCLNPQINIFDPNTPNIFDASSNPWSVFIDKSVDQDVASLINPGIREYTRVFTLPQPIMARNIMRHVLLFGKAGKIVLASLSPDVRRALPAVIFCNNLAGTNGRQALRATQCGAAKSELR